MKNQILLKRANRRLSTLMIGVFLLFTTNIFAHTWEIRVNQNQDGTLTWYLQSYHGVNRCNLSGTGIKINGVTYNASVLGGQAAGSIVGISSNIYAVGSTRSRGSYVYITTPYIAGTLNVTVFSNNFCWQPLSSLPTGNASFDPPPPPVCSTCPVTGYSEAINPGSDNGTACDPTDDFTTADITVNHLACADITGDGQFSLIFDPSGSNVSYGPFSYQTGISTTVSINIPYGTTSGTVVRLKDDDFPCEVDQGLTIPGGQYEGQVETVDPVIVCPGDINVTTDQGVCGALVNFNVTATDNCDLSPGNVVLNYTGNIENFEVPQGVYNITIEARGAQGGSSKGGKGASMQGDFAVTPGQNLKILVGGQGEDSGSRSGGGGGSFVTDALNSPLVIAGGGGGVGNCGNQAGNPGVTSLNGSDASWGLITGPEDGKGGLNGGGGGGGIQGSGGGGGGLLGNGGAGRAAQYCSGTGGSGGNGTDGEDGSCGGSYYAYGGQSFINGGDGGTTDGPGVNGGFGGGGAAVTWNCGGGGGGGYSGGGGGGTSISGGRAHVPGGGGSSINNGLNQVNSGGVNTGNGVINISWQAGLPSIAQTDLTGLSSGGTFPVATTTLEFTATDSSGNTDVCSFDVTVVDHEKPTITCRHDIVVANDAGKCSARVGGLKVLGYNDNCPIDPTTQISYVVSGATHLSGSGYNADGSTFNVGGSTLTYTIVDDAGLSASCSMKVTVSDKEKPTITCRHDVVVANDAGKCSARVGGLKVLSYNDNCPIDPTTQISYVISGATHLSGSGYNADGSTFNVGGSTLTYTIVDNAGLSASCSMKVTVSDKEKPTITCRHDVVVANDAGKCSARVGGLKVLSYNDNCPIDPTTQISYVISGATHLSGSGYNADGSTFNVGGSTLTYTIVDNAGLSASCSMKVTVSDKEKPTITCRHDVVVANDAGKCSARVGGLKVLSYNDNCPIDPTAQISYVVSGATHLSGSGYNADGSTFNVGGSTLTYTIVDNAGLSASCSMKVRVSDKEKPTITCRHDVVVANDAGKCSARVGGLKVLSYNDNCPIDPTTQISYVVSGATHLSGSGYNADGSTFNVGGSTLTYTIVDNAGLSASCSMKVTVSDKEKPTITCRHDVVIANDAGKCSARVGGLKVLSYNDNCPIDPTTQISYVVSGATHLSGSGYNADGSTFNVGGSTLTYTIVDNAGLSASCSMKVTVSDKEKPTITCRHDVVVANDAGKCSARVGGLKVLSYNDNCPIDPTAQISYVVSGATHLSGSGYNADGSTFNLGGSTLTYTIVDNAGLSASCSMKVTVSDKEKPVWTVAPSDMVSVECDPATNAAAYASWLTSFSGSDVCGSATVTNNNPGLSDLCGGTGSATVTFTLTDEFGNNITKDATFTIVDTAPPSITCPASMQTCADQDQVSGAGAEVSWTEPPMPTDACGSASAVSDYVNGGVYSVGITNVTYTATDECGRQTQCDFDIEVWELPEVSISESELPIYCQENSKILSASVVSNTGGITYSWDTGSTTDTIHVVASGVYNVEVTDANGCTRAASYNVTVIPQNLLSAYTIIAEDDVHLHGNNVVLNGGVGVLDDKGKAKIHDESFVSGATTFVQSDKIEINNDSGVDTEILSPSTVSLPPFYANLFDSDNDVTVAKNSMVTLSDQVYDKIDVKEGSTVIFTQTDLYIGDLKTKEDVILKFPSCAFVRVEKNLDFYKNVTVNPDGHQVQFYVDSNVEVKEGSTVNASIDARGHNINVKGKDDNPTFMNGQFIGKKIHGDKYVTWDWSTACDPGCEPGPDPVLITCECHGGLSSVTVDYSGGAGASLTTNDGTITDNGDGTYTIFDGGDKLKSNLEVDDGANTGSMHTSCSQDILGQTVGGSFTVVAHIDMNNETSTVADCPDGVDRLVVNANANAYADLNTTEDSEAVINTEQSKNITEAKVYPNPTTGRITFDLTVDTNATERLLIYNSQGQIIVDRNINLVSGFNSNKIDLSDYHSGLYFIRLGDLPIKRILVIQ